MLHHPLPCTRYSTIEYAFGIESTISIFKVSFDACPSKKSRNIQERTKFVWAQFRFNHVRIIWIIHFGLSSTIRSPIAKYLVRSSVCSRIIRTRSRVGTDLPCLDAWSGEPSESSRYDQIQVPLDFIRVRLAYWAIKLTPEDKDDFGKTLFDRNWHIAPEDYQKGFDRAAESWSSGELPADLTQFIAFSKYTPVSIDYPRPPEGVPAGRKVGVVEWNGPPLDPCI